MAVINVNLFSMALKQNMDCTVVLPNHIKPEEQLKCVWLYHGGSGDHVDWLYHTPLVEYVEERHFAAVLPTVHDSCFIDMNIGGKYGTYVGKELPTAIWQMFRCISSERADNYISGFSNGGYGCLHTALMWPEKFSKAGAFSAGDKADSDFPNDGGEKSIVRIRLYGEGDLHQNEYGLTYLADRLIEKNVEKPVIYHACGGKDPWLEQNHIVRDYFLKHKEEYNYTYDEMPQYGHEWRFWEAELVKFLDFAGLTKNQQIE